MCLPGDTELVRQLHQRLLQSAPAAKVQTDFMGPTELAQVRHDAQDITVRSEVMQLTPAFATAGLPRVIGGLSPTPL